MLKLVNIKKNGQYIEANYIPEDSNEHGYIKVHIKNRRIIKAAITSYDRSLKIYQGHARSSLLKLADKDTIPEKYPVAWY
jgi:hypothetical protein